MEPLKEGKPNQSLQRMPLRGTAEFNTFGSVARIDMNPDSHDIEFYKWVTITFFAWFILSFPLLSLVLPSYRSSHTRRYALFFAIILAAYGGFEGYRALKGWPGSESTVQPGCAPLMQFFPARTSQAPVIMSCCTHSSTTQPFAAWTRN